MKIDTRTMHPRHDIGRVLGNIKSLAVRVGGKKYDGEAELIDDEGHVTLVFAPKKRKTKMAKVISGSAVMDNG